MGTIPTIPTFTAGQILTAAQVNGIKAASDFWALTPRCMVYQTGATSIASNVSVGTVIGFDTEVYDVVQSGDTASHDTVTNNSRIVFRTPGKYEIAGQVQFASNATGIRVAAIRLNAAGSYSGGTLLAQNTQTPLSGGSTSCACAPVEFQAIAGDYIELFGLQNSGGALNTTVGLGNTWLRAKLTGT